MRHASTPADLTSSAPVSVPLLVLNVHDDGTLTATLDGQAVEPPEGVSSWRRAMFAQIVDQATGERATPVRVTVHEVDGSTFTDILPAAKRPAPTLEAKTPSVPAVRRRRGHEPVEIDAGDGFIAGEDVAVALIATHTDATPDGAVRALLDAATIAATGAGEVVLVGRVSGTITFRSLS